MPTADHRTGGTSQGKRGTAAVNEVRGPGPSAQALLHTLDGGGGDLLVLRSVQLTQLDQGHFLLA